VYDVTGLTSLRELYVDHNMLPSLDCFQAPDLSGTLQHLMLTNNSLQALPPDVFSRLTALR
jgi:Leucine-rich repeat (LRR) protein